MAQIIDIEERRRRRPGAPVGTGGLGGGAIVGPTEYLDQVVAPMAAVWRSWLAGWATLWLAPLGLRVSPLEPVPPDEPKERAGPRR
jgi:hypothetical protein